jgi:hypothetical protein
MAQLSDFAEKLLLDWMMTTGTATRPTTWFLALYTAAPSDSGGGTEVTGNGYARQSLSFAAAATPAGTTSNTNAVEFTASGGSWGTITHVAIHTASTGGNMLWHGPMATSRTIGDGEKLNFAVGAVALTLA